MKNFPITISGDMKPITQEQSKIIQGKALQIQQLTGLDVYMTGFYVISDIIPEFKTIGE